MRDGHFPFMHSIQHQQTIHRSR